MKVDNLDRQIGMVGLDVSPAILVPFYDEDSSTLFLTGRGDTTIYAYEVTDEAPYFCPLSHHRCSSLHQGLSFLPKNQCDVRSVEFAKCYRLTSNSIEPLSFTVPRLKVSASSLKCTISLIKIIFRLISSKMTYSRPLELHGRLPSLAPIGLIMLTRSRSD